MGGTASRWSQRPWTMADAPEQIGDVCAVVTGANSGIGLAACEALAARGARVVMCVRSPERSAEAVARVREAAMPGSGGGANVAVVAMDLNDLESVRAAAARIAAEHAPTALLLNAGTMAIPYARTKDGHETQWQTNVLGHYVLAGALLPALEASAAREGRPSRVVSQSSAFHRFLSPSVGADAAVDGEEGYDAWRAYARTKLANILFAFELQRRLEGSGKAGKVMSLACHPGYTATNLQFTAGKPAGVMGAMNKLFAQSMPGGAQPLLRAALDSDAEPRDFFGPQSNWTMPWASYGMTGGGAVHETPSAAARDGEQAKHCWALLAKQAGGDILEVE